MKYLKIVLCCLLPGFLSCDKYLDLAPTDVLIEEAVFADVQTAESALADSYFKLFLAATGGTHVIADASLGHVGLREASSYSNYFGGTLTESDGGVEEIWKKFYEAINVANVFIDKVPVYAAYDVQVQDQHVAEAKFCRAYAYTILLAYFGNGALTGNPDGLGVPLQLLPYEGYSEKKLLPRSTNTEVYAQIINDLEEAIPALPDSYSNSLTTRVRATKATAQALLSRVYLYKRDYQMAAEASALVLGNTEYQLEQDLLSLFPMNEAGTTSRFSKEVIFGFPVSSNNGNFQFGTHRIYYYSKNYWVSEEFQNSLEENDERGKILIFQGNPHVTDPVSRLKKTTLKFNNPDDRDDIIVIRLAEVMLNRAEALAQLQGVNDSSTTLLNQVRERSGLDPLSGFSSKEELLEAIYRERYIELAFEGQARFDFIRTNRPLRNPELAETQKVFPIPQREIEMAKGVLLQNPGYNN